MNVQSKIVDAPIRLAEVVTALSLATDLGMGQPLSFALRACVLSLRLGKAAGMDEAALRTTYFQALLRYIGCNVDTHILSAVVGDEVAMRHDFAAIDNGNVAEVIGIFMRSIRQANGGASALQLAKAMAQGFMAMPGIKAGFEGHCEVAQRLAARLGLDADVQTALGQLYERWDGKGAPHGLRGEAIAPSVRVVTLAQDALVHFGLGGIDAVIRMVKKRRGSAYDPALADCFCDGAQQLLADLDQEPGLDVILALEPGEPRWLSEEELDEACRAMADFVDVKSPYTLNHSDGVAMLAAAAGEQAGLPKQDVINLRRAAWLHDLGRTGISAGIWEKPGPLNPQEWDKVHLHAYYTERVLAATPGLAALGELASMHHERCDGSGYHRRCSGAAIPFPARILAAADMYQALIEARPYRAAHDASSAAAEMQKAVKDGKLDGAAVDCVLIAAGHRVRRARIGAPAGLSEREVEVLRLLAQGHPTKRIASLLNISVKTADHHIQKIYGKTGVSTRAGATLFAMEQGLACARGE
ncbi:MAG: HD domain-containing protein [Burkholderiales bacterium]|nr:HD domain-containing protein [Burkholderiales bacterium]